MRFHVLILLIILPIVSVKFSSINAQHHSRCGRGERRRRRSVLSRCFAISHITVVSRQLHISIDESSRATYRRAIITSACTRLQFARSPFDATRGERPMSNGRIGFLTTCFGFDHSQKVSSPIRHRTRLGLHQGRRSSRVATWCTHTPCSFVRSLRARRRPLSRCS